MLPLQYIHLINKEWACAKLRQPNDGQMKNKQKQRFDFFFIWEIVLTKIMNQITSIIFLSISAAGKST